MTGQCERKAAAERIDAAFERFRARPRPTAALVDLAEYERQRADVAMTAWCHLIGALATIVGSEYFEVTAERVAEAVELATEAVLKTAGNGGAR